MAKRDVEQRSLVSVTEHLHRRTVTVDDSVLFEKQVRVGGTLEKGPKLLLCSLRVREVTGDGDDLLSLSTCPANRHHSHVPPLNLTGKVLRCSTEATDCARARLADGLAGVR